MSFTTKTQVTTRGRPWASVLAFVAFMGALVVAGDGHVNPMHVIALLFFLGFSLWSHARVPEKPDKKERDVSADATGLVVDGKRVMERSAIVRAYYVPPGDKSTRSAVHVQGRRLRRSCTVWVDDEEEATRLIGALALDEPQQNAQFRALPPWAKHLRWLAVLLAASPWALTNMIRLIPGWGIGLIMALYAIVLLPTLLPQRVEVGQDGVFMKWLGNRRFIPFSKIVAVSKGPLGVDLVLAGDRMLEIRLSHKDNGAAAEAHALAAKIKAGVDAHRGLSRADEEAFLTRGDRDVETWLREMRALGGGEVAGYRAAAIPRERLWAIVENPAADPSAREGAALALSTSLDDDERARILALAQKTASPRLRIALDGVGQEREEARLRVALETADAELEGADSVSALRRASASRS